jgi:LacI family transcriptional regulator
VTVATQPTANRERPRTSGARSSMREVAQLAGVAVSSVSRVLSGHPDTSDAMRDRVLAAVQKLGYEPDMLAQSMRRGSTMSVGFVVGDISNPLIAEIAHGAETTLRRAGYSMLLTNSENKPALDAAHIRLLEQRRVDGLLLSLAAEDDETTTSILRTSETPVVLIDRELSADVNASAVLSDHRSGMSAAVEHLLGLGHRDIGLIVGQPVRPSRERRRGLEDAYRAARLEATYTVVEGELARGHGRLATRKLLDGGRPPTAIVAGGNQILVGTLQELVARGVGVGSELSLVSCDDVSITELFSPPIAVVRRDYAEMGRQAAKLLLKRLEGDDQPKTVTLPTEFVARASCAVPAGI